MSSEIPLSRSTMKENYKSSLTLQSKTNKSLDMDKVAEYLNNKKLKEERLREIQNEINRKQRVKDLDFDNFNKEVGDTMKHEFDLLDINQMRHNDKIRDYVNRNNMIFEKTVQSKNNSLKHGRNMSSNISQAEDQGSNSLVIKYHNIKDLSEEQRRDKQKEILGIYKNQIAEKMEKDK